MPPPAASSSFLSAYYFAILHREKGYAWILHIAILPYCHIHFTYFLAYSGTNQYKMAVIFARSTWRPNLDSSKKRRIVNWTQSECANSITIRRITFNPTKEFKCNCRKLESWPIYYEILKKKVCDMSCIASWARDEGRCAGVKAVATIMGCTIVKYNLSIFPLLFLW